MKEGLMLCGFSPSFSTFPIDFEEETVPRKLVYLRSLVLASFWVLLTMSSADSGSTLDPAIAGMIDILKEAWIVKYTNVAFLMLMVYDHAITFDLEVSRIWSLQWRAPKVLFMINRYIIPPMLFFGGLIPSIYDLPQGVCDFVARWTSWPTIIALGTIEIMLILRVLALYNHSKKIGNFLWALFFLEMAAFITISCFLLANTQGSPGGDLFSGCLFSAPQYFYAGWIPPVVFESVIVSLTIYKVFQYDKITPTLGVLARDSLVYFLVMFSILFANLIIARFGRGFMGALLIGPSSVVACIAAARMTMNIREFTMGQASTNPDGSQELKTMRFRAGVGQSSTVVGHSQGGAESGAAWSSVASQSIGTGGASKHAMHHADGEGTSQNENEQV